MIINWRQRYLCEQILYDELRSRGFKSQDAVKDILSITKRENNLRFMNDLFKDVTSFGQNCFNVQIGRGSKAIEAIHCVLQHSDSWWRQRASKLRLWDKLNVSRAQL